MRVLDLFSGIGGFSLAAESVGFKTAMFCEIEPYPRQVLRRHWPDVPIHEDVTTLTKEVFDGALADTGCDGRCECVQQDSEPQGQELETPRRHDTHRCRPLVITAGFPCQDISYAGKGAGLDGERSGLFFEVARLIGEFGPRYVVLENVAALITRGLDAVLGTLASLGFDAVWACIPACAVGAPHRRDRVWIVATPHDETSEERLLGIYQRVLTGITPFGDLVDGWPTATASDAWASAHARSQTIPCNGRVLTGKAGLSLGQAARGERWPTPREFCHKDSQTDRGKSNLGEVAGGALNPDWVETLMGYSIGYTLSDGDPLHALSDRWPAGLGADQYPWEPPRITTLKENRASRLKALGNSIVPQVAVLWMSALEAVERQQQPHTRSNSPRRAGGFVVSEGGGPCG